MINDKTQHIIVAAIFGVMSLPLSLVIGFTMALVSVFVVSTVLFLGKEYYDTIKPKPTGFDKVDMTVDYLGLAAGFIIAFIIHTVIQISKL